MITGYVHFYLQGRKRTRMCSRSTLRSRYRCIRRLAWSTWWTRRVKKKWWRTPSCTTLSSITTRNSAMWRLTSMNTVAAWNLKTSPYLLITSRRLSRKWDTAGKLCRFLLLLVLETLFFLNIMPYFQVAAVFICLFCGISEKYIFWGNEYVTTYLNIKWL